MSTFSDKKEEFQKNKKDLSPTFKPEANIPATITSVRKIDATIEQSQTDGSPYANFKMIVDIETEDGIKTKEWNIGSEALVETLEEKGIDIGSSFTVTKTGEGFKTKYSITNVKNKEKTSVQDSGIQSPVTPTTPTQAPDQAAQ